MNDTDTGPLTTEAMVCPGKGELLVKMEILLPPLTMTQVEVDIDLCGLCHTDIHMKGRTLSTISWSNLLFVSYPTCVLPSPLPQITTGVSLITLLSLDTKESARFVRLAKV
jgi:hypothetical protein